MATIDEQIKSLEEEISKTKYNKATQGHIGKLKAKIAALRERQEKAQAHAKSSGGGPGSVSYTHLTLPTLLLV